VASLGLSLAGPGAAPVALADGPGVQVAITSVTPSVWKSGDVVQISGLITNGTDSDLSGTRLVMVQGRTPLNTVDAVDAALTADPSDGGEVLASMTGGDIGAGESQAFTVGRTPSSTLAPAGSAFTLAVQVLDRNDKVLAQARLIMGSQANAAIGSLAVLLTSRPSLLKPAQTGSNPSPALFQDDHLASDLQGGLGSLLTLAGSPGVTPVIDPGLVDDLKQMAAGYRVVPDVSATPNATAAPAETQGQAAAKDALKTIDALVAQGGAYRTLSGNPDVDAIATQPQGAAIVTTAATLPENDPLAALPLAVVVRGQSVAPAARGLIDNLRPAAVLTDALKPSATVQGDSGTPWVALTPVASLNTLTGPPPAFTGAASVQPPLNRLARLTVADARGVPSVVLVDNGADAATVSSWLTSGWQPRPLAQIASGPMKPFDWANGAASSQPTPDLTALITRVQGDLSIWADLGDIDNAPGTAARRFLPGALSANWGGDWASAQTWLSQASATLQSQVGSGGVSLRIAGEWYLASSSNRMPVTIVNTMGIPVQVRVHFVSENEQRLSIPDTECVKIAPGDATTVPAAPRTSSNGSVQVTVSLVTCNGLPVGASQSVQVVTTAFGRLGWMIIIGAGAAFVIATSLRVRQVRRQRSAAAAAASGTIDHDAD